VLCVVTEREAASAAARLEFRSTTRPELTVAQLCRNARLVRQNCRIERFHAPAVRLVPTIDKHGAIGHLNSEPLAPLTGSPRMLDNNSDSPCRASSPLAASRPYAGKTVVIRLDRNHASADG